MCIFFMYIVELIPSHQILFINPNKTGLCTELRHVNCGIILAGDPKQLDAVTKSGLAEALGFSKSFMETLLEQTCYQRCKLTNQYDSKNIVQLRENYRSHEAILKLPNQLFYNETLKPAASEGNYSFLYCFHII